MRTFRHLPAFAPTFVLFAGCASRSGFVPESGTTTVGMPMIGRDKVAERSFQRASGDFQAALPGAGAARGSGSGAGGGEMEYVY